MDNDHFGHFNEPWQPWNAQDPDPSPTPAPAAPSVAPTTPTAPERQREVVHSMRVWGRRCLAKIMVENITLWLFNIAMDNGPCIDDFPIKTTIYNGFSMAMLNNQMVPDIQFFFFQDVFKPWNYDEIGRSTMIFMEKKRREIPCSSNRVFYCGFSAL